MRQGFQHMSWASEDKSNHVFYMLHEISQSTEASSLTAQTIHLEPEALKHMTALCFAACEFCLGCICVEAPQG